MRFLELTSLCLGLTFLAVPALADDASSSPATVAPTKPLPSPAAIAEAIKNARADLERELIDYPSARFQTMNLWANFNDGHFDFVFCGMINMRNRLGGYTGWYGVMINHSNQYRAIDIDIIPVCTTIQGGDMHDYSDDLTYHSSGK